MKTVHRVKETERGFLTGDVTQHDGNMGYYKGEKTEINKLL